MSTGLRWAAATIVAGLLLSRPTVFAQPAPFIGPAILGALALATWPALALSRSRGRVPLLPLALFALAWLWLAAHPIWAPDASPNLGTSTLTVFVPVVLFGLLVCPHAKLLDAVRRGLVAAIVAVAALTVATLALGFAFGFGGLILTTVPLGYEGALLMLPGSLTYGTLLIDTPRFLGIGREPGMGAIFIGWAFFAMPQDWRHRRRYLGLLLVALVATQSTAGIGILGAVLAWRVLTGRGSKRRGVRFLGALGSALGLYVAVYAPTFGLLAKMNGGLSYGDRVTAMERGLRALQDAPLSTYTELPLSSVNMIAGIAVDGAPWFVLMLTFLIAPAFRRDWRGYSALVIAASLLVSQPLAGSTALMILSLISYSSARVSGADGAVGLPSAGCASGHADPSEGAAGGRVAVGDPSASAMCSQRWDRSGHEVG